MSFEYTIRQKSTNPIASLNPSVMKELMLSRPESFSLALQKFKKDFKLLTGKSISIDHEQNTKLMSLTGADDLGMWKSKYTDLPLKTYLISKFFKEGFLSSAISKSILEDLSTIEAFYDLIDGQTS